jgi:DNA-binding NarL/FixJ family response regulator
MPNRSISTVIVGRHKLLRSGISSLIEEYSFSVVATFGSIEEAGQNRFTDNDPELVLICIQSTERALKDVADMREHWPTCKIVLLFDQYRGYASAGLCDLCARPPHARQSAGNGGSG